MQKRTTGKAAAAAAAAAAAPEPSDSGPTAPLGGKRKRAGGGTQAPPAPSREAAARQEAEADAARREEDQRALAAQTAVQEMLLMASSISEGVLQEAAGQGDKWRDAVDNATALELGQREALLGTNIKANTEAAGIRAGAWWVVVVPKLPLPGGGNLGKAIALARAFARRTRGELAVLLPPGTIKEQLEDIDLSRCHICVRG